MEFKKDYFLEKLYTLKPSEEHMRAMSTYIKLFNDNFADIVDGIEYVYSKSSCHHRLNILYLINETIKENSECSELIDRLRIFVNKRFYQDKRDLNGSIVKKMDELEKIWIKYGILEQNESNEDLIERFSKEDIKGNIERKYDDKEELIKYLELVITHFKEFKQ